jgi:hypothetical protein
VEVTGDAAGVGSPNLMSPTDSRGMVEAETLAEADASFDEIPDSDL